MKQKRRWRIRLPSFEQLVAALLADTLDTLPKDPGSNLAFRNFNQLLRKDKKRP